MLYKKSIVRIIGVIVFLTFMLSACKSEKNEFGESVIGENYEDLTDETFTEELKTPNGLKNIKDQKVFFSNKTIQMDFLFNKDAENWEIDSAWNYAQVEFCKNELRKLSISKYDLWVMENCIENKNVDKVICRVFVNGKLNIQKEFMDED